MAGDYGGFGSTEFATAIAISTITTGFENFTLNASGIANINKSGISKFGARSLDDVDGVAPTGLNYSDFFFADQSGVDSDPKLVAEHDVAVVDEPVQSIYWFN